VTSVATWQTPAVQAPPKQSWPHLPQFFGSFCVSAVHATSATTSLDDDASLPSIDESIGELPSAPPSLATPSSPPTQAVHKKIAVTQRISLVMIEDHIALQLTLICAPVLVHTHTKFCVGGAAQSHE
jgi:hypothetical protein